MPSAPTASQESTCWPSARALREGATSMRAGEARSDQRAAAWRRTRRCSAPDPLSRLAAVHARRSSRVASRIARSIRMCTKQRHSTPDSACLISARRRLRVLIEKCLRGQDHAVQAEAALRRLFVDERLLDRVRLLRRAETLERRDARAGNGETGVTHERTARPPIITVHAPHWPRPQPNFGPRSAESSLST